MVSQNICQVLSDIQSLQFNVINKSTTYMAEVGDKREIMSRLFMNSY